jgi:predicted RNA-binding protein YlqC (UPF0109 family)
MPLELVSYIAHNLVANPDALRIEAEQTGRGLKIEISCDPEDAGRLIGRGGRIINSIRTLARAATDGREYVEIHLIDQDAAGDAEQASYEDSQDEQADDSP